MLSCRIKGEFHEILGEAIKAYIILKDGTDEVIAKEQILKACKQKLALYKIPSLIEFESKMVDPLKLSK